LAESPRIRAPALPIYGRFPRAEIFALTTQMRRAAVSMRANISEGCGKRTPAEKLRFLNIAQGSLEESKYYLILSRDLRYGDVEDLQDWAV
jgi:four helix bundle protein